MNQSDSFPDCGYVLGITTFLFKEEKMDFEKLAIAIIYAWESDREESGRCEIVKGMRNVLRRTLLSMIEKSLMKCLLPLPVTHSKLSSKNPRNFVKNNIIILCKLAEMRDKLWKKLTQENGSQLFVMQ